MGCSLLSHSWVLQVGGVNVWRRSLIYLLIMSNLTQSVTVLDNKCSSYNRNIYL